MPFQLNLIHVLKRSRGIFADKEIVSRTSRGVVRYRVADFYERVSRLCNALGEMGVRRGDVVGALAWNTHRYLELYYAVPCMGAILHTLNLRLAPHELSYIANHARDKVIFFDEDQGGLLEEIRGGLRTVERLVIMDGAEGERRMDGASSYEDLLRSAEPAYSFPSDLDENTPASILYTSGTTGMPKGTMHTHRYLYLAGLTLCLPNFYNLSDRDVVLMTGPLFHAMGWYMPFAAMIAGAKIVMPGPRPSPAVLAELIEKERVSVTFGVPTVWISLLDFLDRSPGAYDLSSLQRVYVGGSALTPSILERFAKMGIEAIHAWGMSEGAVALVTWVKNELTGLPEEEQRRLRLKQGLPPPGIEFRVVDESGRDLPRDGESVGEICYRGAWIIENYFGDPERTAASFIDGWLRTGDAGIIDKEGYVQVVDRFKDLVKSGGEWISSVDLENLVMTHPAVLEAAVIGIPHEKWQERPLALVVLKQGYEGRVSKDEILDFLRGKIAKWQVPDDVVFLDSIPKTSTGKFDKKVLREQFREYKVRQDA